MKSSIPFNQKISKSLKQINWTGYLLLAPVVVGTLVVIIYPILRTVWMSFFDYVLSKPLDIPFIGLRNYTKLFSDQIFLDSSKITLIYIVTTVVLRFLLGLGIALLLNEKIPFRGIARSILIIPWAVPEVVACLIFIQMFDFQYGVINYILVQIGLIDTPLMWLSNTQLALPSAILVNVWKGTPWAAIMLLAGLQSIPEEMYEVAEIDGANIFQKFRNITLPLLKPISISVFLLLVIWTVKDFGIIYVLNKGGPAHATEVLTIFLYHKAFISLRIGLASAAGVVLLIVTILFTIFFLRATEEKESVW